MVNSKRFEAMMKIVPANRILLETDSPFGLTNETHHETLEQVVDIFSQKVHLSNEEAEIKFWENFRQLLN